MKTCRKVGWKRVFANYSYSNFKKSLWKPSLAIGCVIVFTLYSDFDTLDLIQILSNLINNSMPSLIGFVLTGYAIIIGLSNSELIEKTMEDSKEVTLFQRINSTFAIVLCFMIISYILGILTEIILRMNITIPLDGKHVNCLNCIWLYLLGYLLFYTIFSLFDIVINVFNLGEFAKAFAFYKKLRFTKRFSSSLHDEE